MRIRDRELLQVAEKANKMFEDYSQWVTAQPLFDQVDTYAFSSLYPLCQLLISLIINKARTSTPQVL